MSTIWIAFVYLLVMSFWLAALTGIALSCAATCVAIYRWAVPARVSHRPTTLKE